MSKREEIVQLKILNSTELIDSADEAFKKLSHKEYDKKSFTAGFFEAYGSVLAHRKQNRLRELQEGFMSDKLREELVNLISKECGTYQLMVGKMNAIDLDRCGETLIDSILELVEPHEPSPQIDEAVTEIDSNIVDLTEFVTDYNQMINGHTAIATLTKLKTILKGG